MLNQISRFSCEPLTCLPRQTCGAAECLPSLNFVGRVIFMARKVPARTTPDIFVTALRRNRQLSEDKTKFVRENWTAVWVTFVGVAFGALFLFLALPDRAFLHATDCDFVQPDAAVSKLDRGEPIQDLCFSQPIAPENNRQTSLFGEPARRNGSRR